jgi:hypothetical protein
MIDSFSEDGKRRKPRTRELAAGLPEGRDAYMFIEP